MQNPDSCQPQQAAKTTLSLNGAWTVRADGADKCYPANVPGEVHTDLMRAGVLPDPFFGENERDALWVSEKAWIYERTFHIDDDHLRHKRMRLCCDGLDTYAHVSLNGNAIGSTLNMFRRYEWDITDRLQAGENHISIRFDSPLPLMRDAHAERPLYQTRHVPWETDGRGYVRKQQCNFGWDWGPVCVTAGICGDVVIVCDDGFELFPPKLLQRHHADGTVRISVDVKGSSGVADKDTASHVIARLWDGDALVCEATAQAAPRDGESSGFGARCELEVTCPKLWWPNGMGSPFLYRFELECVSVAGTVMERYCMDYGLRVIELIQEPDTWGQSFVFAVNGQRIFAKGANWIPPDAFLSRITPERVDQLLTAMVSANMNMVRVWGGGVYESRHFYQTCAMRGLLVWQDLMFACTAYPLESDLFMSEVEAEVRYQVGRLHNETALALWCGNNELQSFGTGEGKDRMPWGDYEAFFHHKLATIIQQEDPQRPYWPCSPHSPGFELKDDNNPASGDAHLWQVWHCLEPFEWYRTSLHRFCSEFGFQSYPEPKSVAAFTEPADRNITHPVMEHHQRSTAGNAKMLHYMLSWFRMPKGFAETLWLSQIQQGLAIQYAVLHWRIHWPRCAGALFWQLNDAWPAASWSSIDYYGRWKALHYFAKRFFAPVVISGIEQGSTVNVHLHCDSIAAHDAQLECTITDLAGSVYSTSETSVHLQPHHAQLIHSVDLSKAAGDLGERNLILWLTLRGADGILAADCLTMVRPKALDLPKCQIDWSLDRYGDKTHLSVTAAKTALWMWIDTIDADCVWSDNFVCLRPGQTQSFELQSCSIAPSALTPEQIRIRSIADLY